MHGWLDTLADFMERPAGEVCIGFFLIGVGVVIPHLSQMKGEDTIVGGTVLISRALIGGRSRNDSRDGGNNSGGNIAAR